MKKTFIFALFSLLFCMSDVRAQNLVEVDLSTAHPLDINEITEEDKKQLQEAIEDRDFSYEIDSKDFELSVEQDYNSVTLPDCNDERLFSLIKDTIKGYQAKNPAITIIGRRKQTLMIKNLAAFEEISSNNITSKTDFKLANQIIDLKMNEGVLAENIRVCKGPEDARSSYMYLVIYNIEELIIAKILNFAEIGGRENDLEILY